MTYTEKVMKEFREKFVSYGESTTRVNPNALKELESFLTTALENQRKEILDELPEEKFVPKEEPKNRFGYNSAVQNTHYNQCLKEVRERINER